MIKWLKIKGQNSNIDTKTKLGFHLKKPNPHSSIKAVATMPPPSLVEEQPRRLHPSSKNSRAASIPRRRTAPPPPSLVEEQPRRLHPSSKNSRAASIPRRRTAAPPPSLVEEQPRRLHPSSKNSRAASIPRRRTAAPPPSLHHGVVPNCRQIKGSRCTALPSSKHGRLSPSSSSSSSSGRLSPSSSS
ncbi:hypothetical protein LINPERPRIM_LOCUS5259 [Linum perenne]